MADTLPDLPDAVSAPTGRRRLPLIWLVPLVAVLAGGWLAVKAILDKGPTITITFRTAEGLEAGKTKIRYKDVEIGLVKAIALSDDRAGVEVTAELVKDAEPFLVEDTRFWVVRPRIAGGGVSGLGTLLSGAYIGVDVGKSQAERRRFVGLEVPPVVTAGRPGREFVLKAEELGSVSHGTPVYFRKLEVGEVVAYGLDKDGEGFTIRVFVHAPYDQFVNLSSRFWHASGIDVSLEASGIKVNTESLASILLGGIAFGTPSGAPPAIPALAETTFKLHATRGDAYRRADSRVQDYMLVFRESVRGLEVGAPVDFRGIVVGEVASIHVDFDDARRQIVVPVEIRFYPDRMLGRARTERGAPTPEQARAVIDRMIASGFRGQLRTGNLITGQLYVALDFFPNAPKAAIDWTKSPPEIPTIGGGLQELQTTLASIAAKLDKLPYEQIAGDLRQALQSLDRTLKGVDTAVARIDTEVTPELKSTLAEARRTFANAERTIATDSPLQQEMRDALREVARAAASVRALADALERHPESLIRGRREEETQ